MQAWHANEVHVLGHRSSELTWPAASVQSSQCAQIIGGHELWGTELVIETGLIHTFQPYTWERAEIIYR